MSDLLVVDGVTKQFPGGLIANDRVSLRVERGHVHALLGENGAGKSTLMKILYGMYRPDTGTIQIDGHTLNLNSPQDARHAGIGMVFQSFMLIPAFSVVENVALSLQDLGVVFNQAEIEAKITEISNTYGFGIDPKAKVWQLSIGAQQKVEIIKVLLAGAKLLIFDEPTSVLAPHEAQRLFEIFDALRTNGYTIIFISHKLNEVLQCCDAITVLRQGRVVGSLLRAEATEAILVSLIVGVRSVVGRENGERKVPGTGHPVVELQNVAALDDRGRVALSNVALTIRAGEILGVAGVSGNGQKELGEVIQGSRKLSAGTMRLMGEVATGWSTMRLRQTGVTCIPEDPLAMGAVGAMTVQENLALGDAGDDAAKGWRPINWKRARAKASALTERFQLQMPPLEAAIQTLSGGNVQRVVCAREMALSPRLLLAFYPTRGMDIHAAEIIRSALRSCRDDGAAILLVSEDLDELFTMSDRIVVMYHGQNVGECLPEQADMDEIGFLMTGGKRQAA